MSLLIQKTRAGIVWSIFSMGWLEWEFGIIMSLTPGLQRGVGISIGPVQFSAYRALEQA